MDPVLPKRVLVLSPVGAYIGRVKTGINWALARTDVASKKVEVNIIFLVARTWAEAADPDYERAVGGLIEEFNSPDLIVRFKQFKVGRQTIDVDDETCCTVWLVRTLAPFLRSGSDTAAFIDMTSGPKEWIFACHYVAELFDRLCFYNVKSKKAKMPRNFVKEEREDLGSFPEIVILSGPDQTLTKWITENTDNWRFFKCICDSINEACKASKKPVLDVGIPEGEIAEAWKTTANFRSVSDARRSASKYINAVEKFGLFVKEMGTIRLSHRGYALGLALEFELPEEAEEDKP